MTCECIWLGPEGGYMIPLSKDYKEIGKLCTYSCRCKCPNNDKTVSINDIKGVSTKKDPAGSGFICLYQTWDGDWRHNPVGNYFNLPNSVTIPGDPYNEGALYNQLRSFFKDECECPQ